MLGAKSTSGDSCRVDLLLKDHSYDIMKKILLGGWYSPWSELRPGAGVASMRDRQTFQAEGRYLHNSYLEGRFLSRLGLNVDDWKGIEKLLSERTLLCPSRGTWKISLSNGVKRHCVRPWKGLYRHFTKCQRKYLKILNIVS